MAAFLLDDEFSNALVSFPDIPGRTIDYETLNLFFRKQGETVVIEAVGSAGERVEVPTQLPSLEDTPSGEALGEALMPGNILKVYTSLIQKTTNNNKGLRIQLDFPGAAAPYAHFPWERASIGGQTLLANPRITLTRTVASPVPALPFEASQKPYRILVILANPEHIMIKGEKRKLPPLSLNEDYKKVKEAVQPLMDEEMLEMHLLEGKEASIENVTKILAEKEIHSLYFAGYSGIEPLEETEDDKKPGYIILDSPEREGKVYTGSELIRAAGLANERAGVRMVFLSANESAYGKDGGEGLAEAFLRAGIPAVVAYNTWAWEDATPIFAGAFFSAFIKRNSLDLAMFAGRKALCESSLKSSASWYDPMLFSRVKEGKRAFAGELAGKVATYVNADGDLVVMEQKDDQSLTDLFTQLSKNLEAEVKKIHDIEQYAEVQNHITDAHRELRKNPEAAIDILSEASLHAARALKQQEVEEENARLEQEKRWNLLSNRKALQHEMIKQRSIVLSMAGLMFVLIGVLSFYMEGDEEIGILGLPISIVLWSLIGGVGATLYAFVGTQKQVENEPLRLDWLIGRPLVGIIMGCVVYLTVATSISALTSVDISESAADASNTQAKPYLLWALAFLGGFSDKFALLLFSNLVGKYTTGDKNEVLNENEEPLPPKPVDKKKEEKKNDKKDEQPHKETKAEAKEREETEPAR